MVSQLGSSILILFGICAALAFLFPFFRDGVRKQLSLKPLLASWRPFALVVGVFAALFGVAGLLAAPIAVTLPCFLGAALLAFVVAKTGMPPLLRGVIL